MNDSFFTCTDVNVICGVYSSVVEHALDSLEPLKSKLVTIRPQLPWISCEILSVKTIRRKAEEVWRKSRLADDRAVYREQCRMVSNLMNNAITDYFKNQIENCRGDQRKLFEIVNNVLTRKHSPLPSSTSSQELANKFVLFFQIKIEKICDQLPPADVSVTNDDSRCNVSFSSFESVSFDELKKIIMGAPKSTCKLDPAPTRFIIECLDEYMPFLQHILNLSLQTGIFPDSYKNAHVKPLIKKPTLDPEILKNYRPVSNLPYFSKIIERVVAAQVQQHMDDNNLNNPHQSAYRKHHSCETANLKVQNDILRAMDRGFVVIHVMLDLSAAFDTLDHAILLKRLENMVGVSGTALSWFASYLSGRSQQVVIDGSVSAKSKLTVGVPQGSVLGPILFNIYTLPLYQLARDNDTFSEFYADDSQLYVVCNIDSIGHNFNVLETCIFRFMSWMSRNRLKLNGDKTEMTVFAKPRASSRVRPLLPSLHIDNATIDPQPNCRVLGSFFDSEMSMEKHISNFCKSANFQINNIYSIRKYLDPETLETLVHAFVSSRMDYCNSLLFGITKQNLKRLQRVQNRVARLCLGIRKYDRISNMSLLRTLHWLPVSFRIEFKLLLITFKCIHGLAPPYLSELIDVRSTGRTLRSSAGLLLDIPKSKTKTFGERAFSSSAPRLWNDLPLHLRSAESVATFKSNLKTYMFQNAFPED